MHLILLTGALLLGLALLYEGFVSITSGGSGKVVDFDAQTLDGKRWSLAEHRGKRPVVLNFFATWCGPCKLEYPHLAELQKKHAAEGLQVVLLTDEPAEVLKEFPELTQAPLIYIPDAGEIKESYGVNSIPHTFVFNREGQMVKQFMGYDENVPGEMEKLLQ